MTLLDEAMAAVSAGGLTRHGAVGEIYCRLLSACERATDVRRAEQWMAVARRFDVWSDFVPPTCRTHYSGILIAIGRWAEAEEELLAAIRTFESGYRGARMFPLVRLAGLRVRQGRFEEAERLLEGSEWHPAARRSLATIALARGDLALAVDLAHLCLEGEDPSDPASVPVLELLIDIQLARGDLGDAGQTLDRLSGLAASSGDDRAAAGADLAAGRVRAAEGDERTSSHLRTALERFSKLELPLEAARAQLELARALAAEAPAAAEAEARLALRTFERLGAARDADAAADVLRGVGASGRAWPKRYGTLTKREAEVFSLLAAGCSNAEIGERLYISRRTAEHHVAEHHVQARPAQPRRSGSLRGARAARKTRSEIGSPTDATGVGRGHPRGHGLTRERLLAGSPSRSDGSTWPGCRPSCSRLVTAHRSFSCMAGSSAAGRLGARGRRLAERHRVVVPDLPGLGESEPVDRLDADTFADWFAALLRLTCEGKPTRDRALPGWRLRRPLRGGRHGGLLRALVIYAAPGIGAYRMPLGLW